MSHKRDISTKTGENRCHGDIALPAVFSCQRKSSLIRKTPSLAYRNHALGLVADWRQNNPQKSWSQWLLRLPPAESHQALRFRLSIITRHDPRRPYPGTVSRVGRKGASPGWFTSRNDSYSGSALGFKSGTLQTIQFENTATPQDGEFISSLWLLKRKKNSDTGTPQNRKSPYPLLNRSASVV